MNKIMKFWFAAMMAVMIGILPSCTKEYLDDVPELPDLPRVTNLKSTIDGFDIILSWNLPVTNLQVSSLTVSKINANGQATQTWDLAPTTTTFTITGAPMGEETGYTVKVKYDNGQYSSMGETIYVTLPEVNLAPVSNLKASVDKRSVTLSWTLPQSSEYEMTGIRIYRSDNPDGATVINEVISEYVMKSQPMDEELTYNVEAIYGNGYLSAPASVNTIVPYVPTQVGFLLLDDMGDDDELAAIQWFASQPNSVFVSPADLATLSPEEVSVLWIMVDRVGLEPGWQNLPAPLPDASTIDAIKAYSAAGGSLYLSNMATQLTAPLGIVPMDMAPNIFASGPGGNGDDVWVINPHLGWDFKDGSADGQGYYDRAEAAIFKDIVMEDPNGYGYDAIPLIGPGQREDHNCMWDLNVFGRGNQPDVVKNFEVTTNCMIFATWGHVRDHCVAGLVEFLANTEHGRCIAMGFAAYEWNQNSGPNPYQDNVELLTANILNYLK